MLPVAVTASPPIGTEAIFWLPSAVAVAGFATLPLPTATRVITSCAPVPVAAKAFRPLFVTV
jgi:hypothetical protein